MTNKRRFVDQDVVFLDNSGDPLSGGLVYAYSEGTTNAKDTYTDKAGGTTNANPVVLDGNGRASIWLDTDEGYKIVVKTSAGTTLATVDNVVGSFDPLDGTPLFGNIQFADATGILDDSSNVQLIFQKTTSAVNYIEITNAATGNAPDISATGDDSNVDLTIGAKGTGVINLDATPTVTGSASAGGGIRLAEDTDNGTNYIELQAPASIASNFTLKLPSADGSTGQALTTDGSGNLSFSTNNLPNNYITGMIMSNDTDTDHDIQIGTGDCKDSTNATDISLTSVITKQIDATWAAGDDAGGLPAAVSLSADTWYHVFVIKDTDTGTVDAGFDTSVSATNLLSASSYESYRRVGSVLTDGSANILGFTQVDDEILWDAQQYDYNGNATTTATNQEISTPPDVKCLANLIVRINNSANNYHIAVYSNDKTDEAAATSPTGRQDTAVGQYDQLFVMTDTSSQIRHVAEGTSTIGIFTWGYKDFRGRNG